MRKLCHGVIVLYSSVQFNGSFILKESDLFNPVKSYLEGQGYTVYAEVKNCDITARKDDELIIVELKKSLNLKLIYQIIRRQELCESVYAAVAVPPGKKNPPNYKEINLLLKRLGAGLILVRFMRSGIRVEVKIHPGDYMPRKRTRRREMIIREMDGRYAEFNKGGIPSETERITSYKQEALHIAALLAEHGASSPRQLRARGCGPKTQPILSVNVYGWFQKKSRGIYELSDTGFQILKRYSKEIHIIRNSRN